MDKVGCNTIASEDEECDKTHIKRIWLNDPIPKLEDLRLNN